MTNVRRVARSDTCRAACELLRTSDDITIAHMRAVASIPAPTGHEAARANWFAERLLELGLAPTIDEVGNVSAITPAAQPAAPRLVLAAHLDSVFPADIDLAIRDEGSRIVAPGISDNARGLAATLALARALQAGGWPLRAPVELLATVGEEGAGDLRGVKHWASARGEGVGAFIALDGAGATRVIATGVGSRRLRIEFSGRGGHSWSDFGTPNAIHAAGRAVSALADLSLSDAPRTTLSVGRIGGGTSINAIAAHAWVELDLRSEGRDALARLEERVHQSLHAVCEAARNECGELRLQVRVFGDRPAGSTSASHPLVRAALDATRHIGQEPELASSSTDANAPMAAGIPAIAIGTGGEAGGTHTLHEWYDNRDGVRGLERALLVLLAMTG